MMNNISGKFQFSVCSIRVYHWSLTFKATTELPYFLPILLEYLCLGPIVSLALCATNAHGLVILMKSSQMLSLLHHCSYRNSAINRIIIMVKCTLLLSH